MHLPFARYVNLIGPSKKLPLKGDGGSAIQVVIVAGFHLFPFRTEKLSPPAPMVLPSWESR